jgi:putative redox protein
VDVARANAGGIPPLDEKNDNGAIAGGDLRCKRFQVLGRAFTDAIWKVSESIGIHEVIVLHLDPDTCTFHGFEEEVTPRRAAVPEDAERRFRGALHVGHATQQPRGEDGTNEGVRERGVRADEAARKLYQFPGIRELPWRDPRRRLREPNPSPRLRETFHAPRVHAMGDDPFPAVELSVGKKAVPAMNERRRVERWERKAERHCICPTVPTFAFAEFVAWCRPMSRVASVENHPEPFRSQAAVGPHRVVLDVDTKAGGADFGPDPHELLYTALAACTSITVDMVARRKQIPVTRIHVAVAGETEAGTLRLSRTVTLDGDLTAEQRAFLLGIAEKCPIHKVLTGATKVTVTTELAASGTG